MFYRCPTQTHEIAVFFKIGTLTCQFFQALCYFAEDEETASMIMMTFTMPMMFLGGIFFPIQMMPSFMQTIAH